MITILLIPPFKTLFVEILPLSFFTFSFFHFFIFVTNTVSDNFSISVQYTNAPRLRHTIEHPEVATQRLGGIPPLRDTSPLYERLLLPLTAHCQ